MQFNSSLNKQEYILALTQVTKEQSCKSSRYPWLECLQMVFVWKKWDREYAIKNNCWEPLSTKVSHLVSFGFLSGLVPRPLVRYKSNWSNPFWSFEHSCNGWAREESWHLKGETESRWRRKTKTCERLTSMRRIIGERRPYDIYDVRSRDFHSTDAHVS